MGHWVDVSGYMVVNNAIPTHFSKLHNDEGMWTTEPFCMSPIDWLDSLLMGARKASSIEHPWAGLPTHIVYRHYNLDTDEEEDEAVWVPQEDERKLVFPAGNEGPADLTVTSNIRDGILTWHVVIAGSLGDDCHSIKPFVEWWETITKYLDVAYGHFWCKGMDGEYSNFYSSDNDDRTE